MVTIRLALLLAILAFAQPQIAVPQNYVCPTTKPPVAPFIPPAPWQWLSTDSSLNETRFPLGTPGLWAFVRTHWAFNIDQKKMQYFSERYDWKKTVDPPLSVVARRLDSPGPLVWARWVNGAGPAFNPSAGLDSPRSDGAMITSLEIPSKGCWEISAHLTDARDKVETLTYVVLVD